MGWWEADPVVEDSPKAVAGGDWWQSDPVVDSGESAAFQAADEQQAMERGELKPAPPANPIPFLEKPLVEFPHLPVTKEQSFPAKLGSAALNKIGDFVSGTTSFQGLIGLVPPVGAAQIVAQAPELVEKVKQADLTPPGSPERIDAGLDVVAAIGSLGALGAGAKAGLRPKESVRPSIEAEPKVTAREAARQENMSAIPEDVRAPTIPETLSPDAPLRPIDSSPSRVPSTENTLRGEPEQAPSVPKPNEAGEPLIRPKDETALRDETPPTDVNAETATPQNTPEPTSTKNAVVESERESRGIQPAEQTAKREFGTVWDEAEAIAKADTDAPRRLVESINENPRALTDKENALLLRRQIEVQNEHDAAVRAVNEAVDDASRMDATARLERVRDDLQAVYDAGKAAGTETGRGLNARKMMANDDFSLAKMEATTRAIVNDGKPLSPKQAADVAALHERIRVAERRLAEYETREKFNDLIKEAQKEARARKASGKTHRSFLEERAAKARERIKEMPGVCSL